MDLEKPKIEAEKELKKGLSSEEILFFKQIINEKKIPFFWQNISISDWTKIIAEQIRRNPEVGKEEFYTSELLASLLEETIPKDKIELLLVDKESRKATWVDRKEFQSIGDKKGKYEMGGVFGILEGDDPEGPTIFIRGDMDALPPKDDPKHLCGHNIHTAWLVENAYLLNEYKKKFGSLPFKKVVLIGEVNEEGTHPIRGPQEMIGAGMIEKTGKPDFIIGAHITPFQPEGHICIENVYGSGRISGSIKKQEGYLGPDLQVVYAIILHNFNKKFEGEEKNEKFGDLKILADMRGAVPETFARIIDSKKSDEKRELPHATLKETVVFNGSLADVDKSEFQSFLEEFDKKYKDQNISIEGTIEDGNFEMFIKGRVGHAAFGGPNAEAIYAETIYELNKRYGKKLRINPENQKMEFIGTIRLGGDKWKEDYNDASNKLKEVISEVKNELRLENVKIDIDIFKGIPPIVNDKELSKTAENVIQRAGIGLTHIGLPGAGADTFAYFLEMLNIPGLYLRIGGGNKQEIEDLVKSGEKCPPKMMLHNPSVYIEEKAIPYGAVESLIALEISKSRKSININDEIPKTI